MDEQNHMAPDTVEEISKARLQEIKRKNHQKNFIFALILLVVICLSVICTFALTYRNLQSRYADSLRSGIAANASLQNRITDLEKALEEAQKKADVASGVSSGKFQQLELLDKLFETYSYYADDLSDEELGVAVMKAYTEATGDRYAEYYTDAEYAELSADTSGNYEGIGISVLNEIAEIKGVKYSVYLVISIYEDSHAWKAGLKIGDYIYAVKEDGEFKTIDSLGGYSKGISTIRGPKGTSTEILVFRENGDGYESIEMTILRDSFVSKSVTYKISETDPSIGIIKISEFDLTTPGQLKESIADLQQQGISKFIFDLRNNPGGDLRSIRATLSYFFNEGDLILATIDRENNIESAYTAGVMAASEKNGTCNVTKEEIGMFHDLSMVVLCNEHTASAAEVFVAGLQDYGLATIVGDVTYGKGILQSYIPLAYFGSQYSGYAKLTTHAYMTQRGETYHEIGVTPDVEVALSEEAAAYSIYLRPETLDNQLQSAIAQFQK